VTAARAITVRARRPSGRVVDSFVLGHGEDPIGSLLDRGFTVVRALAAHTPTPGRDDVVIDLEVDAPDLATSASVRVEPARRDVAAVPTDDDLRVGPGERAHVHQRLAAYAVITRGEALLLTELSASVRGAAGRWTLPGGGLDPGESPVEGLVREVWEETGHEAIRARLVDVSSAHWIGRSPRGRLEDYHVVRLVHRADVTDVRDPVVHDVDGSTARAAWVSLAEVRDLPLTPLVASGVSRWLGSSVASGGLDPDDAEDRDDDAGGDDDEGTPA
jgi:8-oxo-dGTP diphosphatase